MYSRNEYRKSLRWYNLCYGDGAGCSEFMSFAYNSENQRHKNYDWNNGRQVKYDCQFPL